MEATPQQEIKGCTFTKDITLEAIRQSHRDFCTRRDWDQYHTPRNLILALVGEIGELSEIFQWRGEVEVGLLSFSAKDKVHVGEEVSDCLINLIRIADRCDIDLPACAFDKVSKNAKKYPANRVKGLSKKYNEYEPEKGKETEKEKENASNNNDSAQNIDKKDGFTADITIEALRQSQEDFCNARDWIQYHTPRNILLALIGEIGELAEIFQWRGEVKPGLPSFTVEEKVHVGEELSDCLLYLIRLSDRCGVDLPLCAINKIEKNAQKYPEDKCKGSAKKYNEYERETKAEGDRHDGSHADAVDKGQHTERAGEKPSKKRTGAHDEGTNCDAKKQRHA